MPPFRNIKLDQHNNYFFCRYFNLTRYKITLGFKIIYSEGLKLKEL